MGRFLSDDANCGRARAWISQELDGELSQIERLFLAPHVRRCSACARFAEEVRGFTKVVRSTPLESPAFTLELPAQKPARTRVVARVAIATALVSLAGGLGVLAGSGGGGSSETTSAVGDIALVVPRSADRELRDLRRVKAEQRREPIAPPGRLGGVV